MKPLATLALVLSSSAFAQTSNIDTTNKWSWGENIGFMNWRDAGGPIASQGALINTDNILGPNILSGFVWQENTGFINLGDGTPANGTAYANLTGTDFGVNILNDNRLAGLAWGENVGWINFGPHATLPALQQARYDSTSARLRGYAWGENIGWVNLDDSTHFVGVRCPADFNNDGVVDLFDYLDFVAAFAANDPAADFNQDAIIDFFDYLDFVAAFSASC